MLKYKQIILVSNKFLISSLKEDKRLLLEYPGILGVHDDVLRGVGALDQPVLEQHVNQGNLQGQQSIPENRIGY